MSILFYLFVSVLSHNEAARILGVFPTPSISHQVVFRPLVQELARRGHEVVVITTDPAFPKDKAPANLTEIDVHDVTYKIWREHVTETSRGSKHDIFDQMKAIAKCVIASVDVQLKHEDVIKLINDKNQKFDLLLIEACVKPALIFSHIYNAPVIQVSSFGAVIDNYEVVGAPSHPLIYPSLTHQKIYNLTVWDKIREIYNDYVIENIWKNNQIAENELFRKHFGKNAPTITDLNNNVHMLFLNVHPIFEGIRPVPPSVVYMGGVHQMPEKELPADLKSYLDFSKNGVIYVSFGTNVDPSLLPPEKIQTLVKVLSQLPYDILWKWNTDELPGRTDNIRISKWLPQSDLLKHPKIKLFITQGGLQSTDEAITAGVPLVGIPMLGDQWYNVEKYLHYKIGVAVEMESLTEEGFRNSVNTVLNDDSYRKNIIRLRELMRDEPMKPLERAVWWTEYVLRHGGAKHLRSPIAGVSWAQYLELELVLTLLVAALAVIAAFITSLTLIYRYVLRNYFVRIKIKQN